MKKTIKILLITLMALLTIGVVMQPAVTLAADAGDIIGKMDGNASVESDEITNIGNTIVSYIWVISIVVAVVVLMIIGVQFIVGSASQKAEYKKSLIPLAVGIIIIVFGTSLVKIVFSLKGNG